MYWLNTSLVRSGMSGRFSLTLIIAITLCSAGCPGPQLKAEASRAEFVLGTVCTITLYDQGKAAVYRNVFSRLREIENLMSANLNDSDLSRINAAAGKTPVKVHKDVFKVVERALYFAETSGGAFDPTVGPLVSLWGIGTDNARLPPQEEIDAALPLVNWRDLELDREQSTVFLKRPGMALDLGAIAKGFAADEAAAILAKAGIKQAIVDLGGNVLLHGEKQDKSPWRVGIQNPFESRGSYVGVVQGKEQSVVTSGIYERFFEAKGRRYHHILSPADGYPARSGLASVTISGAVSMDADALSTAVFALGYEKGRALVDSLKGIEALFIFEDKSIRKTAGMDFTLSDREYRLLQDR